MDSKLTTSNEAYQMFYDPIFEADAPKFFDFETLLESDGKDQESDDNDDWFEKNAEALNHENELKFSESQESIIKKESSIEISTPKKRTVLGQLQSEINSGQIKCSTTIIVSKHEIFEREEIQKVKRDIRKPKRRSVSCGEITGKIGPKKLTVPQSPNLHTATRIQHARDSNENLNGNSSTHQNDVKLQRNHSITRKCSEKSIGTTKSSTETLNLAAARSRNPQNVKVTTPKPFSFQNRELEFVEKRKKFVQEAKLKLEEEQLKYKFKARPAPTGQSPCLKDSKLAQKKNRSPLIIKPFNFKTDQIHFEHERKFQAKKLIEEECRKKMLEFHAQPAKVLHQQPFKPKFIEHLKTIAMPLTLETERRAENRQKFDEFLKDKEQEKFIILKQRQLEKEIEERLEVLEIRRLAVHKAQPVKHFKDVGPRPQAKVTVPQSPRFKTVERAKKNQG